MAIFHLYLHVYKSGSTFWGSVTCEDCRFGGEKNIHRIFSFKTQPVAVCLTLKIRWEMTKKMMASSWHPAWYVSKYTCTGKSVLYLLSCCYLGRVGKSASSLGYLETFCQWSASLSDNLLWLWAQLIHGNCSHVLHHCGPCLLMRHHQFFQNSVRRSRDGMCVKTTYRQRVCCWRRKALPLLHYRNLRSHFSPYDHPVSLQLWWWEGSTRWHHQ